MRRLHWKTDLLARIEASERAAPAPLGASAEPFAKVVATGRFDHAREALLGVEVRGTTLGAHLLTPLLRAEHRPLLVDRGWVPFERDRPIDRPAGEVSVTGFVREADRRDWLSPADDARRPPLLRVRPGRDRRGARPLVAARALRPRRARARAAAPAGAAPSLPEAARSLPRPNNPHLGYAITWYGLAASLVAVLAAFMLQRRRDHSA